LNLISCSWLNSYIKKIHHEPDLKVIERKEEKILCEANINKVSIYAEEELGLPDLSLCTITQMAEELKTRENINFALVWIENSEKDNISLQAKGNATQIIGLLARGQQIALDWTNQNLKYKKKND
jgi:hypothetical protein